MQLSEHLLRLERVQTINGLEKKTLCLLRREGAGWLPLGEESQDEVCRLFLSMWLLPHTLPKLHLHQLKTKSYRCGLTATLPGYLESTAENVKRWAAATRQIINMIRNTQSKDALADGKAQ